MEQKEQTVYGDIFHWRGVDFVSLSSLWDC
jgi:hypothetical protein